MSAYLDDAAIAQLAGEQDGVFARWQIGMTRHRIGHRLATGRWHIVYRGVYSLVPRVSVAGRRRAAVLTFGPHAHAAGRLSANLHGLGVPAGLAVIARSHSRDGITVHRVALPPQERAVVDGIPVTSVARTLADLARTERFRVVERAIERADQLRLFDLRAVEALDRRASAALRAILARVRPGATVTRSGHEEALLAAVRAAGLPEPVMNDPYTLPDGTEIRIDAHWPAHDLAVEVDDRTHMTPEAFARDRHRDRQLTIAGKRPVRIPVTEIPQGVRDLVSLLRPSR